MSRFVPPLRYIQNVTNAQLAVVTFTEDHDFKLGEIVSFRSSRPYGMYEINNISTRVIDLSSDTITVELDTLNFNAFVYPPIGRVTFPAIVVPAGSSIIPGEYVPTVTLEDVFDNIPGA